MDFRYLTFDRKCLKILTFTVVLLLIQVPQVAVNPDSVGAWSQMQSEQSAETVSISENESTGAEGEGEASPATQQPLRPPSVQDEGVVKSPHPNLIPYRSRKSLFAHFVSLPARVWRLIWTPIGTTIVWIEQDKIPAKKLEILVNEDRTAGVLPLATVGGDTPYGVGTLIFHHNLSNGRKKIDLNFLYYSEDNSKATFSYADAALFGSSLYFDLLGKYLRDSRENLFIVRDSREDFFKRVLLSTDDDKTSYATKEGKVDVNFGYTLHRHLRLGIVSRFKHADIGTGEGIEKIPTNVAGFGEASLFSIGPTLTFDFRNGWPRTPSGTLVELTYQYNRELDDDRFEYNRYSVEAHQFIPVPFLQKNRRFGIRARLEKIEAVSKKAIPFYELSRLGDAEDLRGFDQNRFRGEGSLLFNIEYRYPIWDTWDAVIFLDEGQVFNDFSDLDINDFHCGTGAGLRFMSRTGFIFRTEVGVSRERLRALFEIEPNF